MSPAIQVWPLPETHTGIPKGDRLGLRTGWAPAVPGSGEDPAPTKMNMFNQGTDCIDWTEHTSWGNGGQELLAKGCSSCPNTFSGRSEYLLHGGRRSRSGQSLPQAKQSHSTGPRSHIRTAFLGRAYHTPCTHMYRWGDWSNGRQKVRSQS